MAAPALGKRATTRAERKGVPDGPPRLYPCAYCKGTGKVLCQPYKRKKVK